MWFDDNGHDEDDEDDYEPPPLHEDEWKLLAPVFLQWYYKKLQKPLVIGGLVQGALRNLVPNRRCS